MNDYDDFKIDDKVIVWNYPELKDKRHFAGLAKDGRPKVFSCGRTSWTGSITTTYDYCVKADTEE